MERQVFTMSSPDTPGPEGGSRAIFIAFLVVMALSIIGLIIFGLR